MLGDIKRPKHNTSEVKLALPVDGSGQPMTQKSGRLRIPAGAKLWLHCRSVFIAHWPCLTGHMRDSSSRRLHVTHEPRRDFIIQKLESQDL